MKFVITGHPRSGTGSAAQALMQAGYDVGHERLGKDGISSWAWAAQDTDGSPFGDAYRPIEGAKWIYLVCNPIYCVASVAFTEGASLPFRCKHVDINPYTTSIIHQAVDSIYKWAHLIEESDIVDHVTFVRTDCFNDYCRDILGIDVPDIPRQNTRSHPDLDENIISAKIPEYEFLVEDYQNAWPGRKECARLSA